MMESSAGGPAPEECPICGSASLIEVRCKVVCGNCRTIVKSCADLHLHSD